VSDSAELGTVVPMTPEEHPVATHQELVGFVWSVADLLRGDYKQSEYGRVMLPLVVLRRLDCVLEPTKADVLAKVAEVEGKVANPEPLLRRASKQAFFNTSALDLGKLLADPDNIAANLRTYINAFSPGAVDVLDKYGFDAQITRLDEADLLYPVVAKFAGIDLHPERVSNLQMGYVFEELIRRFSEISNETAGEHFTPREVIRLMVNILFAEDTEILTTPGIIKSLYDPACGTGGMLSVAEEYLRELNPAAKLEVFGQELNGETYAICRSDMMLKGQDPSRIAFGNSFSVDGHQGLRADYLLANPPFGVEWKKVEKTVRDEYENQGFKGRFGAGLPRINDGSLLFLQHMISKMKPASAGGSRLAIVFNGSPLFTGAAGSGESEIRRWILENDWLEAIVALPDQLFYNTGISTYFWVLSNHKAPERAGKVALIDARDQFVKMRKSLGEKRKEISPEQIARITRCVTDALEIAVDADDPDHGLVKVFATTDFGYHRITVERPLRLRYRIDAETLPLVQAAKAWVKLTAGERATVAAMLDPSAALDTEERSVAEKHFKESGPLPKAIAKAVWDAVSVRDAAAPVIKDKKGNPEPDSELRDFENVPLSQPVDEYLAAEVLPHVPDAWVDDTKTKVGYEIPFTRHFYRYTPLRSLAEVDADLTEAEAELHRLLRKVAE
jgi:type I restriction enzyme M protein